MSDCSEGSCETKAGSCSSGSCGSSGSCKMCETNCGNDPIACATAMWCCAFKQAMHEVQVELLKERIRKGWGAKMSKAADAVIEGAGVQWGSMLAQAKAKQDFRQLLAELWQEK